MSEYFQRSLNQQEKDVRTTASGQAEEDAKYQKQRRISETENYYRPSSNSASQFQPYRAPYQSSYPSLLQSANPINSISATVAVPASFQQVNQYRSKDGQNFNLRNYQRPSIQTNSVSPWSKVREHLPSAMLKSQAYEAATSRIIDENSTRIKRPSDFDPMKYDNRRTSESHPQAPSTPTITTFTHSKNLSELPLDAATTSTPFHRRESGQLQLLRRDSSHNEFSRRSIPTNNEVPASHNEADKNHFAESDRGNMIHRMNVRQISTEGMPSAGSQQRVLNPVNENQIDYVGYQKEFRIIPDSESEEHQQNWINYAPRSSREWKMSSEMNDEKVQQPQVIKQGLESPIDEKRKTNILKNSEAFSNKNTTSIKENMKKKRTPNGVINHPSDFPMKLKSEKSSASLRTPTKMFSPKTPEKLLSSSLYKVKKLPMNKIQVGAAPLPNLRHVRSKIGSLDNYSYKPGGGNVKIENHKLEWNVQPKIENKNMTYTPGGGEKKIRQVKLQWNAKSKVGSLDNTSYQPGGGFKKIETVKLDFRDKAKPKVGSKKNIKYIPGGGTIKIEDEKVEIKAESKLGSLDNVNNYKPGGGDRKIFNDRDYLRQTSVLGNNLYVSRSQDFQ